MEAVILIGLQGCGKSSFYQQRFFHSHVRISLDLLKTRHREQLLLDACLATDQRFVVDNTNPAVADRLKYIALARAARFAVAGYYFQSRVEDCLRRNAERPAVGRVPDVAILSTAQRLEIPTLAEGFDSLCYVRIQDGKFVVEEWQDEVR